MMKKFSLVAAALVLATAPTTTAAATFGFNLSLTVAQRCTVQHKVTGFGAVMGDAVSLGSFSEFCNAPAGYDLVINYAPGSLRGAQIIAGHDQITLDGSGRAVLSRATGPQVRERPIAAVPGANGFDTDRFELAIVTS